MAYFKVGSKVKVHPDNDNECYDSFRGKILIVTHVARSKDDHPGYDSGIGEPLYDMKIDKTGKSVPCSLYHYELVRA